MRRKRRWDQAIELQWCQAGVHWSGSRRKVFAMLDGKARRSVWPCSVKK
jgi:hypothetical protein